MPRSRRLLAAFGDDRLVEQLRRGNEAAFEAIYDRHHRAILSFCRHMLASPDEAEDAVQHTFLAAYDSLRSSERDIRLKPWLFTIARNRCLSILRARREQPAELSEVPTAGLAESVQQRSELRELLADMRKLPDDQRAALVLAELGDFSHADIGAVLDCEAAKVKALVFQARSSLLESRNARDTPCEEIREQLATASGGALRRGPLRRHLKVCSGCAEFRDSVRRQRRMVAAVLPVVPSVGLKKSALAAVGLGGGGGGGAAAAGGASSGVASVLASSGAVKAVAILAAAGVAVGGGVAVRDATRASGADSPAATGTAAQHGHARAHGQSAAAAAAAARGRDPQAATRSRSHGAAQSKGSAGAHEEHTKGADHGAESKAEHGRSGAAQAAAAKHHGTSKKASGSAGGRHLGSGRAHSGKAHAHSAGASSSHRHSGGASGKAIGHSGPRGNSQKIHAQPVPPPQAAGSKRGGAARSGD